MGGSIVKATFFKRARRLRRGFIRASIYAGPEDSRNDSRNVFVNCVLSCTYGRPANPVSC